MKLGVSHLRPPSMTDEHLKYLKQMGVQCVEVRTTTPLYTYDHLGWIKDTIESAGFELHEIMLDDLYTSPNLVLRRDGCDRDVALFQQFVRDLGRLGIGHTTYAWHTGGGYQTSEAQTRGCRTRGFEASKAQAMPDAYERTYDDDEMWANYAWFIEQMLPVAEESCVKLQLHPNDPPMSHEGVARIFRSTDAFRRAMAMCNHSPYSGILFCVGCWAEMCSAPGVGEDVVAAIREFGSRGQILQVHFRNIGGTLPDFHETFPDNGYLDMVAVMRALAEVNYQGMVVPDHVPATDIQGTGEAFIFGYIRALIQAVQQNGRGAAA